jgi:hypothetical protein
MDLQVGLLNRGAFRVFVPKITTYFRLRMTKGMTMATLAEETEKDDQKDLRLLTSPSPCYHSPFVTATTTSS